MKTDIGFRELNLARPVYLVDDTVQLNEHGVILARVLFPSTDTSLDDRAAGYVSIQHIDAVRSNLLHTLLAVENSGVKKQVRIVSETIDLGKEEVRQGVEIEVALGYVHEATGYEWNGKPVYAGSLTGGQSVDPIFRCQFSFVMW